jgi:mRNA interferase RelE/StbE
MLLDRVEPRISALAGDPRPPGCQKLTGTDMYRIRVGDHRIVYRVNDGTHTILIVRVRHRRDAYRQLR